MLVPRTRLTHVFFSCSWAGGRGVIIVSSSNNQQFSVPSSTKHWIKVHPLCVGICQRAWKCWGTACPEPECVVILPCKVGGCREIPCYMCLLFFSPSVCSLSTHCVTLLDYLPLTHHYHQHYCRDTKQGSLFIIQPCEGTCFNCTELFKVIDMQWWCLSLRWSASTAWKSHSGNTVFSFFPALFFMSALWQIFFPLLKVNGADLQSIGHITRSTNQWLIPSSCFVPVPFFPSFLVLFSALHRFLCLMLTSVPGPWALNLTISYYF